MTLPMFFGGDDDDDADTRHKYYESTIVRKYASCDLAAWLIT